MLLFYIGIISTAFSMVAGQNPLQIIQALPNCAQACTIPVVLSLTCNITTLPLLSSCLCSDVAAERNISKCVQQSCNATEQLVVVRTNNALCVGQPVQSKVDQINLSLYVTAAITFPLIFLRLISRFKLSKTFGWDDGLIILATLTLAAVTGVIFELTKNGFGKHLWNVDPDSLPFLFKLFYVMELLYIGVQVFAKISILIFYVRIFPQRWFRWTCFSLIAFLIVHGIAFFLVMAFQCLPVRSIWDQTVEKKCLNQTAIIFAGAGFSIAEDVIILLLPLPCVWKLNLGRMKRFNLVVMFSLGSFACIASMIRLNHLADFGDLTDPTFDNADVIIWSTIEIHLAVICLALPVVYSLLTKYFPSLLNSRKSSPNVSKESDQSKSDQNSIPLSSPHKNKGTSKVNTLHATIRESKIFPNQRYEILETPSSPSDNKISDLHRQQRTRQGSVGTLQSMNSTSSTLIIMKPEQVHRQDYHGRNSMSASSGERTIGGVDSTMSGTTRMDGDGHSGRFRRERDGVSDGVRSKMGIRNRDDGETVESTKDKMSVNGRVTGHVGSMKSQLPRTSTTSRKESSVHESMTVQDKDLPALPPPRISQSWLNSGSSSGWYSDDQEHS